MTGSEREWLASIARNLPGWQDGCDAYWVFADFIASEYGWELMQIYSLAYGDRSVADKLIAAALRRRQVDLEIMFKCNPSQRKSATKKHGGECAKPTRHG